MKHALTKGMLAVAAGTVLTLASAHAELQMNVGTRIGIDTDSADIAGSTAGSLLGRPSNGVSSFVTEDGTWESPCPSAPCEFLDSTHAVAAGEIATGFGRFRSLTHMGTESGTSGAALVDMSLTDIVQFDTLSTFVSPRLQLHIDLTSRADSFNGNNSRSSNNFDFSIFLTPTICNS